MAMGPFDSEGENTWANVPSSQAQIPQADTEQNPPMPQAQAAPANAQKPLPLTGMEIGAALGLLKSIGDQSRYGAQSRAEAAQTRWSPWTHFGVGKMPADPNSLGSIAALTSAGGAMQQGMFKPTYGYGTPNNGTPST